jgi:hypothetical protein
MNMDHVIASIVIPAEAGSGNLPENVPGTVTFPGSNTAECGREELSVDPGLDR